MAETGPITAGQWEPTKKMTREELLAEVEKWRAMWSWVDDETKYWLSHIGAVIRVIQRNYQGTLGVLLQPRFALGHLEIGVTERVYDPNTGSYFVERKTVRLPSSSTMSVEFIAERSPIDEITSDDLAAVLGEINEGVESNAYEAVSGSEGEF